MLPAEIIPVRESQMPRQPPWRLRLCPGEDVRISDAGVIRIIQAACVNELVDENHDFDGIARFA